MLNVCVLPSHLGRSSMMGSDRSVLLGCVLTGSGDFAGLDQHPPVRRDFGDDATQFQVVQTFRSSDQCPVGVTEQETLLAGRRAVSPAEILGRDRAEVLGEPFRELVSDPVVEHLGGNLRFS